MRQRLVVVRDRRAIERDAEALGDVQLRQLPQPTEQATRWAPGKQELAALVDPYERARDQWQVASLLARRDHRELGDAVGPARFAALCEGTHQATR